MAVMGTKLGTKAFAEGPRDEIKKSSGVQNLSATDKAKMTEEDIGSVLNKIADPNWVDPSKKPRAVGNDKMDKDAFMKLMFAQMKNQDPTNPLKSHEMAAQLAQFSQLEQLQNVNTTLTEMQNGQKPQENFQALNFIGKAVTGDSARLTRTKGDKDHEINFNLPDDASTVNIKVRNSQGEVIRKVDLKDLKKGENKFTWNGQDERGTITSAGDYQFIIEAMTGTGKKLAVKTDFDGIISGVSYNTEGPVLHVGTQSVKLKDVKKIIDPSLKQNDQKNKTSETQDLKKETAGVQNKESKENAGAPDKEFQVSTPAMMDSVGMSRELQSRVEKETR